MAKIRRAKFCCFQKLSLTDILQSHLQPPFLSNWHHITKALIWFWPTLFIYKKVLDGVHPIFKLSNHWSYGEFGSQELLFHSLWISWINIVWLQKWTWKTNSHEILILESYLAIPYYWIGSPDIQVNVGTIWQATQTTVLLGERTCHCGDSITYNIPIIQP